MLRTSGTRNTASERPWLSSNAPDMPMDYTGLGTDGHANLILSDSCAGASGLSPDLDAHYVEPEEPDGLTSLPEIPDAYAHPVISKQIEPARARPMARHSFSNILSSLEDFRHAAGRRLKPRRSFVRKTSSAIQEEDGFEKHTGPAWLKGKTSSMRRSRRPSELAMTVEHKPQCQHQQTLMVLPRGQYIDHKSLSPAGGEGARAAAAMARMTEKVKDLDISRSLSPGPSPLLRRASYTSSDNESGVEFDIGKAADGHLVPESVVPLKDPAALPTEIFSKIMTFLDSETLMNAELVSRQWHGVAATHHAWKFAFTREFTEPAKAASGTDQSVLAGGFGLGFDHGYQPWKQMWRVRRQLDQRWREGHAAAIYLVGHHDSVYCVQFDGKKIITGSRDWTVRVWDAATLRCTHVLGTPKEVTTIHHPLSARKRQGIQPTVSLIPTASHEGPICVQTDQRHMGSVLCIDYDEELMVTGSSDRTIIVWSSANGEYKALKQLKAHTMGVLDVRLSDTYIVACSKDTTVSVWDRKTLNLIRVLNGHRGPVNAVQLRGNFVVSASGDGVAKMWNLTTGVCVKEFHPPEDENANRSRGLACVEFTHDARTIFAGGNDKKVYQFDTASGNMTRTFTGHENLVRSLHYDAANGRIVTGSYDHAVWTYDFETGEPICNFKNWTTSWMLSAKADYRRIVAASQDGKALVMDFGHDLPGVEMLEGPRRS